MKGFIALVLTIAVIAGMYFLSPFQKNQEVYEVSAVLPEITNVYNSVTVRGTIVEQGRQELFPDYPSTITQNYVTVGQTVSKGDLLMVLTPLTNQSAVGAALFSDVGKGLGSAYDSVLTGNIENTDKQNMTAAVAAALSSAAKVTDTDTNIQMIYSPINGMVMEVGGSQGDSVSGILPCVVVSDLSKLAVQAEIGEDKITSINEGMSCTISVESNNQKLTGTVTKIMPYARQTGLLTQSTQVTTRVLAKIDAPYDNLRPGYSVSVKMITDWKPNSLILPYKAIDQDENNREYVLVAANGVAQKHFVSTGYELDDSVEITGGIKSSDQVILEPSLLRPNVKISVKVTK